MVLVVAAMVVAEVVAVVVAAAVHRETKSYKVRAFESGIPLVASSCKKILSNLNHALNLRGTPIQHMIWTTAAPLHKKSKSFVCCICLHNSTIERILTTLCTYSDGAFFASITESKESAVESLDAVQGSSSHFPMLLCMLTNRHFWAGYWTKGIMHFSTSLDSRPRIA